MITWAEWVRGGPKSAARTFGRPGPDRFFRDRFSAEKQTFSFCVFNFRDQEGVGDYYACDPRIDTKGVMMADSDMSVFYTQQYATFSFVLHFM